MVRSSFLLFALTGCALLTYASAAEDSVVFRSDVSLVRVDAQVLDRDNRAITGLKAEDFVLRDQGRVQPIRNFSRENMPVDVLLLFDVSASMRPHVERIASAAHEALNVLNDKDRVGIMVFDRSTRVRLDLRSSRSEVERELENMLRQESFRGGTDITRGLLDAASYIGRQGRKDARRAIVILTDDQTEFERDEARVGRALEKADAVLMALIAPDAMANGGYGGRRGGGGYPSGGGGLGGPLGGIILGRGGYGGRRGGYPGGGTSGGRGTKSAGTSEIARDSGGDSVSVDDASAFEDTLNRIRNRYALHFLVPPGARSGQERTIEVALADTARRRSPDADIRYRKTYISPSDVAGSPGGPDVTSTAPGGTSDPASTSPESGARRRRMVSEPDGPHAITPVAADTPSSVGDPGPASPAPNTTSDKPTLRRTDQPTPATGPIQPDDTTIAPGRWRKVKPVEQQQL